MDNLTKVPTGATTASTNQTVASACPECSGTGWRRYAKEVSDGCDRCNGTGYIPASPALPPSTREPQSPLKLPLRIEPDKTFPGLLNAVQADGELVCVQFNREILDLIVTAVNAYAELVAACRMVIHELDHNMSAEECAHNILEQSGLIRDALRTTTDR